MARTHVLSYGDVIARIRDEKRISQKELEDLSGGEVKAGWLAALESGRIGEPSLSRLESVAKWLGTTVGEIRRQAGYPDSSVEQKSDKDPVDKNDKVGFHVDPAERALLQSVASKRRRDIESLLREQMWKAIHETFSVDEQDKILSLLGFESPPREFESSESSTAQQPRTDAKKRPAEEDEEKPAA